MNIVARPLNPTEHHYTLSEAERALRIELAAAFRVAHHYRWNLQVLNHITARLPDHPDRFLMNRYGLGWDEITASNLVTIDFAGRVLSHRTSSSRRRATTFTAASSKPAPISTA
jgi:ribulose-5-phosphate 4-epimerase/fuculose-1-phosphate aldolase